VRWGAWAEPPFLVVWVIDLGETGSVVWVNEVGVCGCGEERLLVGTCNGVGDGTAMAVPSQLFVARRASMQRVTIRCFRFGNRFTKILSFYRHLLATFTFLISRQLDPIYLCEVVCESTIERITDPDVESNLYNILCFGQRTNSHRPCIRLRVLSFAGHCCRGPMMYPEQMRSASSAEVAGDIRRRLIRCEVSKIKWLSGLVIDDDNAWGREERSIGGWRVLDVVVDQRISGVRSTFQPTRTTRPAPLSGGHGASMAARCGASAGNRDADDGDMLHGKLSCNMSAGCTVTEVGGYGEGSRQEGDGECV